MHDRTRASRCVALAFAALLAACAPDGDTGPAPYAGPAPLDLYLQTFTRAEYDAGTVPLAGDLLSLHSRQAERTQCAPATWTTADGVLVIVGATGPHYRALWLR